jgi:hypothetical protein
MSQGNKLKIMMTGVEKRFLCSLIIRLIMYNKYMMSVLKTPKTTPQKRAYLPNISKICWFDMSAISGENRKLKPKKIIANKIHTKSGASLPLVLLVGNTAPAV